MLWNAFFQKLVKAFNSSISLWSVDWWVNLPLNSQLFSYLLKQSIFELCAIVWQDLSAVPKCECNMGKVFVHDFLCRFGLQWDAEHVTCQHAYDSEGIFVATGCPHVSLPTRSMEMNSMDMDPGLKLSLMYLVLSTFCLAHTWQCLQCMSISFFIPFQ